MTDITDIARRAIELAGKATPGPREWTSPENEDQNWLLQTKLLRDFSTRAAGSERAGMLRAAKLICLYCSDPGDSLLVRHEVRGGKACWFHERGHYKNECDSAPIHEALRVDELRRELTDRYDSLSGENVSKPVYKGNTMNTKENRPVLVTTSYRGVFFGYASKTDGDTIHLKDARNCIYWSADVKGFLGLANFGPSATCRVGPKADIELRSVTCVAEVTPEAVAKWESSPWT